LWVGWIVEGLQRGRVAAVFLVHHAYFDGIGAGYILQQICNAEPSGDVPPPQTPWVPEPWPSARKRLWWALQDLPGTLATVWPRALRGIRTRKQVHQAYEREGKPLPPTPDQAPETPLSQPLSLGRTYACRSFALDDFKRIGAAFGVTINDVFVACCAGAVRRLLADRSYDPDRGPLVASIPLSRRGPENMDGIGNFTAVDYMWLKIDVADPVERLRQSHEAARVMKEHFKASEGETLHRSSAFCRPPARGSSTASSAPSRDGSGCWGTSCCRTFRVLRDRSTSARRASKTGSRWGSSSTAAR
jgi:diacylglycerol O-acyltransferase / wax synthase